MTSKTQSLLRLILIAVALISACSSTPPPPTWQADAFTALNRFSAAYLRGNTRLADFEFARAKTEIASTGRADLLARAELTRCATRPVCAANKSARPVLAISVLARANSKSARRVLPRR